MQTLFTPEQLRDPAMQSSEKILRTCVHSGFCTATCPTYLLLGDELDSPRGRIYLMKEMLESGKPATPEIVKHIDRCLSCLSCMTTCPSGVHYMHLVDHGRAYIEQTYKRPWHDRVMRSLLAAVLPYPSRMRAALFAANLAKPFKGLLGSLPHVGNRLCAMIEQGQRAGIFRADMDARFAAVSAVSLIPWFHVAKPAVAILLGAEGGPTAEQMEAYGRHAAEFALAALAAPRPGEQR